MKTTQEYIDMYNAKYNELQKQGELWRLRLTQEEFLKEVERARKYGIEARHYGKLTEYHIQRSEEGIIAVPLMNLSTLEEVKQQVTRIRERMMERYAADASNVQEYIKQLQVLLKKEDTTKIYEALWAKQITLEIIPDNVLAEFKRTQQYEILFGK